MPDTDTSPPRSRAFRALRWIGVACACLLAAMMAWGVVDMIRGPRVVAHVGPADAPYDLPDKATDVCYRTRPAFWPEENYEFSIDEDGFRRWAEANGHVPLVGVGPEPYRIRRYTQTYAEIAEGLRHERTIGEAGGGWQVAFDRRAGRAYVCCATR